MRPHRVSIELDNVKHNAPIPMGARVGNMIFSSAVLGKDPSSGQWPEDARSQAKFCFANLQSMLMRGGSDLGDVGHMTIFISDNSMRQHVNEFWVQHFPDETNRPARHILVQELPRDVLVQIEAVAVLKNSPQSQHATHR